ncbi:MAG TPA: cytochrome c biogenesis protein CcsA [Bacteroidales bacterium]|nr:cytochrome c biogenesis protein CcsA [Bacteroidales bacterium]HPT03441.1 cytochrome c biogenesis protein CcsA [Bacteroidales bacterium]
MNCDLKKNWWKLLGVLLVLYSVIAGFLVPAPELPVVHESVRNLFFHVVMWFTMMVLFAISLAYSVRFLLRFDIRLDQVASQAVNTGLFFGIVGIITGMEWAAFTWGTPWTNDPQLNGAAVTIMAYLAYGVLRRSVDEESKRARISAVYNIFAFVLLVVFIGILPRMAAGSLHPATGGSPSTVVTMKAAMRWVFYPALTGWILVALWILQLRIRYTRLKDLLYEEV